MKKLTNDQLVRLADLEQAKEAAKVFFETTNPTPDMVELLLIHVILDDDDGDDEE